MIERETGPNAVLCVKDCKSRTDWLKLLRTADGSWWAVWWGDWSRFWESWRWVEGEGGDEETARAAYARQRDRAFKHSNGVWSERDFGGGVPEMEALPFSCAYKDEGQEEGEAGEKEKGAER